MSVDQVDVILWHKNKRKGAVPEVELLKPILRGQKVVCSEDILAFRAAESSSLILKIQSQKNVGDGHRPPVCNSSKKSLKVPVFFLVPFPAHAQSDQKCHPNLQSQSSPLTSIPLQ